MSNHTPGPWHEHSHRQIGPDAGIVCEVWSSVGANDASRIAQADANVRLIAAAPDLLEALRGVLRIADRKTDEFDAARAAIAKATGGE